MWRASQSATGSWWTASTPASLLTGGVSVVRWWELVARRLETGVEIEGQGFVVRGIARTDVDLELPPGKYRVRAVVATNEGPAFDIDLSAPGTHASIDLRPK